MKTSIAIRVIAALLSSATVIALELPIATSSPSEQLQIIPAATPAPALLVDEAQRLDLRQAGGATAINNAATLNPLQYPSITTQYQQTMVNGVTTYLPVVYTQTFAEVPDQWASPIPGQIGLGTLSKEKRDAPEPTVYLIPMEMVLQTVSVVVPIQPVLDVQVIQPLTLVTVSLVSDSPSIVVAFPTATASRSNWTIGTGTGRVGGYNSSFYGSTGASQYVMAGFGTATAWNSTYWKV